MSWVTDVVLIFSFQEIYFEEDLEEESLPALQNINAWLKASNQPVLNNFSIHATSSAKSMQSCIYGGAFNYLDIDGLLKVIQRQNWRHRLGVQILIKEEQDECFIMHSLRI
jgi:hypothetical protein